VLVLSISLLAIKEIIFLVKSSNNHIHVVGEDFDNMLINFCIKKLIIEDWYRLHPKF
jgi:molecular chaperone DnaK (HSP70)